MIGPGVDDFYVGVPNETFLALFDGFERIAESDSPQGDLIRSISLTQVHRSLEVGFEARPTTSGEESENAGGVD